MKIGNIWKWFMDRLMPAIPLDEAVVRQENRLGIHLLAMASLPLNLVVTVAQIAVSGFNTALFRSLWLSAILCGCCFWTGLSCRMTMRTAGVFCIGSKRRSSSLPSCWEPSGILVTMPTRFFCFCWPIPCFSLTGSRESWPMRGPGQSVF